MRGLWTVAEAKIQHYVPQYYLRSFIDTKDQLYVVDRPRGKFFRVPTKKVGGELYFNLINVKGVDPFAVEKALAKMEGMVAPALERVKAARSLANEQDQSAIMNLIAAVTLRNPKQRAAIGEIVNQAGQRMLAAGLVTRGRYDEYVAAMKAEGRRSRRHMKSLRRWSKARRADSRYRKTSIFSSSSSFTTLWFGCMGGGAGKCS
jgi:hypothetical protein